ncbi:MAG TPA: FtsK/SpoIIIE domain-containing protein, partial [Acidimicrobiales bacterium]|nr:FtsK/SpoIIIE domain-containing protein [Acidimicrobiales bacterium]
LATQRPSGVVSPAIRTNTNLRVALRVTDASDSIDVIDSPLAARISKENPGRAYLRVGHENLSEFQSARVGGHRQVEADQKLELRPVDWTELGDRQEEPARASTTAEETDLFVLVDAVRVASVREQIEPPKKPWLDPLPDVLVLDQDEEELAPPSAPSAVYGLEDRPTSQEQVRAEWDIASGGHLLAVGDAGSGRSTFLRTLATSLARRNRTADVHLYGIDCGNGALLPLQELPHCGAVVSRTEHDRVDRVLTRLIGEVSERQRILSLGGFSSIADQRRAAAEKDRLPYVVVLLDRWEGFVAEFDALDAGRMVTAFQHLMKEAPGVGIRVVMAGDKSAMSARVSSLVPEILVLRLNDRGNYSLVGIQPRTLPEKILPGRCFRGGTGAEVQVGLLTADSSGPAQAEAVRAVAAAARARDADTEASLRPQPIGVLPQVVALDQLWDGATVPPGYGMGLLVGAGGDQIEPVWVDLRKVGPAFVVGGPPGSGRSNALAVATRCALAQGAEVLIVCARPSPLAGLAALDGVIDVVDGPSASREAVADVLGDTSRRLLVVVDDAEFLGDSPLAEPLTAFIRAARDADHAIVVGGTTTEMSTGFRGFVPEAKKSKAGLLLCPGAPGDGELLGVRLPRTAVFQGPPGRGVLTLSGGLVTVQVPLDTALGEH